MIFLALTCTSVDLEINKLRISRSINNFKSCFGKDLFVYVVYQSKQQINENEDFLMKLMNEVSYVLSKVNYMSVSRARNEAIKYATNGDYSHFIFHDSSIFFTANYLSWVKKNLTEDLLATRFSFTDVDLALKANVEKSSTVYFKDFSDIYVWSYVFNLKYSLPMFNENFGPGENSRFMSGEDFLFFRQYFKAYPKLKKFLRYSDSGILHPARPLDYSKHLAYAEGQGKIHQLYWQEEKSLYSIWRLCLFFGNATYRVLLFRPNSLRVLRKRVKGFFDRMPKS